MPLAILPEYDYWDHLETEEYSGEDVEKICTEIHEACKGWGANEGRLLKALGDQSQPMRCKVHLRYQQIYGKELKDVMRSECGSDAFGLALQYLATSPLIAECDMIKHACSGMRTNDLLIYTIIGGRVNEEMQLLKKKFYEVHGQDLGTVLNEELGGNLETLIENVLQGDEKEFDPEYHTEEKAREDVEKIYKAGMGSFFTNEKGLFSILVPSPPEYVEMLDKAYADKYGYTLSKTLEKELSGDTQDAALFVLGMKLKPYEAIAKLIDKACKGFFTKKTLLTTVLIRYQDPGVFAGVSEAHQELFGKSIQDRIYSETSGQYKDLLLEVLKVGAEYNPEEGGGGDDQGGDDQGGDDAGGYDEGGDGGGDDEGGYEEE